METVVAFNTEVNKISTKFSMNQKCWMKFMLKNVIEMDWIGPFVNASKQFGAVLKLWPKMQNEFQLKKKVTVFVCITRISRIKNATKN